MQGLQQHYRDSAQCQPRFLQALSHSRQLYTPFEYCSAGLFDTYMHAQDATHVMSHQEEICPFKGKRVALLLLYYRGFASDIADGTHGVGYRNDLVLLVSRDSDLPPGT